jgi:hypothetical protein
MRLMAGALAYHTGCAEDLAVAVDVRTETIIERPCADVAAYAGDPSFPMETTYTSQPIDATRTRMTLRNRGEPAGLGKVAAPVMAAAMRRANDKDLANLKRILEAPR